MYNTKGEYKMKASESIPNYAPKLREYANYTARQIKDVCKTIGPRAPGEEAEKKAQERFADELKKYADDVKIEPFELHPKAFLGWIRLCAIIMIVANGVFFAGTFFANAPKWLPVIPLALSLICLFFIVTEFLFYGETLDPFFPKRTSHNVVARYNANGTAKKRIIVSGHVDSSYEWRYTYLGGPPLITTVIGGAVAGIVIALVAEIYSVATGNTGSLLIDILRWVMLAWCILFGAAIFFLNYKLPVEGANDNLTGSIASIAVMKYLKDNNIRFEDVEVWTLLTGSEEAGLRGAKAFAKEHKKELEDMETVFIGVDTLRDYDFYAIYSRDMTFTVKSDAQVCALLKQAALNAGLDLPYKAIFLGASDAAAVCKAGFKGATLAAMDPAPARYYHTRLDTGDNLDLKSIETGINIMLESVFLYDEQGLKDNYNA